MLEAATTATMAATAMAATEIAVGSSVGEKGRYRLDRVLGTGGMATVWLAFDARLERPVAIKILSDVLALNDNYVARFRREARVAASLSHRNLVDIYDFSVTGTRPLLVMEYVEGGTLADRLRRPRAVDWDPEQLFRELLEAVAHIHAAGIVHRDIKPANILIGRDGHARITDFGIAHPSAATALTQTGLVLGTLRYIAPEVLRGTPATQQSDLYACGVMFTDCLQASDPQHLHRLATCLRSERPAERPASAVAALRLLDHPATSPRTPRVAAPSPRTPRVSAPSLQPPRVTRVGREVRVHLTRATAIALILVAVLALIVIAIVSSGSHLPERRVTALPATASFARQLDRIDQTISHATR